MQVAKFNRSAFNRKPTTAAPPAPHGPAVLNDSGADEDFDDFGGHGVGIQDTEIAPGIHAEFGCFTRRVTLENHEGAE